MNLDENTKSAVQNLSDSISLAVEKSFVVLNAIETLRELGYEPTLNIKLEIGLHKIRADFEDVPEDLELDLSEEDVRTLQRMKIRF